MKIIAIGRNYTEHAKELGNLVPEKTVFFMKPETAVLKNNKDFYYPSFSKDIHYETEIVFQICKVGKSIEKKFANRYYDKIGIGIDFTARDLQRESKEKGLPWEHAKAFDNSAPLSNLLSKEKFTDVKNINFSMTLNGEIAQQGNTKDMINDIDSLIAFVSQYVTLKIGDLIYTGTPKGVGSVKIGDKIEAFIENDKMLECNIK